MKKLSPVWLGLVLTFLGILVTICIAYYENTSNELKVEWVSTDSLVSNTARASDLQVLFEGEEVNNPKLVRFQVKNSGTEPISKSDFDTPLQLEFDSGVTLLKASVSASVPNFLPAKISITNHTLELKPLLLNSGDTLNISLILSGDIENVEVLGRIARVPTLELVKYDGEKHSSLSIFTNLSASILLCIMYMYFCSQVFMTIQITLSRVITMLFGVSSLIGSTSLWDYSTSSFLSESSHNILGYTLVIIISAVLTLYCIFKQLDQEDCE